MKFHELNVTKNASKKRVGRGIAAGQGKTAGRGTKGQKARTGHHKLRAGFMGGQRQLMQAVPKLKGFKSLHDKATVVYSDQLNAFSGEVDNFALAAAKLIKTPFAKVKLVQRGELTAKLTVKTQGASKTVVAAIVKQGGKFEAVGTPKRPAANPATK